LFGCFVGGWLADKFGRAKGIFIGCLWCILGAALQSSAMNMNWMICARVITGFGTGHLNSIVPAFAGEIATTRHRGAAIVLVFIANYVGITVAYWLEFGLRYYSSETFRWRFPLAFQIIPVAILAVAIWTLPESPRWLIKEGRDAEAIEVLSKFRKADPDSPQIQSEIRELKDTHELSAAHKKRESVFAMVFGLWSGNLHYGRRVALAMGVMLMMKWTGILAITVYANVLFTKAGFDPTKAAWLSGLCNTTGIFATATAALTVDRIGRRMSMYIGFIIQAITMFLTGAFAKLQELHPQHSTAYGAAAAAMVFIYTWVFAQTVLQVAFIYPAEIWPTSVRAKGNAFGVAGWAIGCGWTTLLIPIMFGNLNERTLYIFGAMNIAWVPVTYCFFPETANRSLEEINMLFASKSPFAWAEEKEFLRLKREGVHANTITGEVESNSSIDKA
jgi:sugar porter (SP) family MFS transporter